MKIEKTRNTPYIFLDKVECILDIKGLSYPEHPGYFYQPLLEEINNCLRYLQDEVITINIALEMMKKMMKTWKKKEMFLKNHSLKSNLIYIK